MQAVVNALASSGQAIDGGTLWELFQQTVTDQQQQAAAGIECQDQTVEVGQLARQTRDELERVKNTVSANCQRTKQQLEAHDANLKQTVDVEVARIKEAGQGLEVKVAVAARQLQDVEAKHTVLFQEAQQIRQDIQKTQNETQQSLQTLQQGVSDAFGRTSAGIGSNQTVPGQPRANRRMGDKG